jgi:hypothetical protein
MSPDIRDMFVAASEKTLVKSFSKWIMVISARLKKHFDRFLENILALRIVKVPRIYPNHAFVQGCKVNILLNATVPISGLSYKQNKK